MINIKLPHTEVSYAGTLLFAELTILEYHCVYFQLSSNINNKFNPCFIVDGHKHFDVPLPRL